MSNHSSHRYFVWLSYDGANYHGWQIQPNGNSVQAELQHGISLLLHQQVEVTGAGRTDAGVHARQMVAHFDTNKDVNTNELTYRLNRLLPHDISISFIREVHVELHARFSATSRTYHYYIHTTKNPFLRTYSWETHYRLDFHLMNEAASCMMNYEDFGAFCKSGADVKTTLCHVTEAKWVQDSEDTWHFRIVANRFLRNMVRAVVGTLIDVGRHRISVDDFQRIIEGKKRSNAGESMPPHALFLEGVEYNTFHV